MMSTADIALKADPDYEKISRRFYENLDEFANAFARTWKNSISSTAGCISFSTELVRANLGRPSGVIVICQHDGLCRGIDKVLVQNTIFICIMITRHCNTTSTNISYEVIPIIVNRKSCLPNRISNITDCINRIVCLEYH